MKNESTVGLILILILYLKINAVQIRQQWAAKVAPIFNHFLVSFRRKRDSGTGTATKLTQILCQSHRLVGLLFLLHCLCKKGELFFLPGRLADWLPFINYPWPMILKRKRRKKIARADNPLAGYYRYVGPMGLQMAQIHCGVYFVASSGPKHHSFHSKKKKKPQRKKISSLKVFSTGLSPAARHCRAREISWSSLLQTCMSTRARCLEPASISRTWTATAVRYWALFSGAPERPEQISVA